MVDVQVGSKKTPLRFDKHPRPEGDASLSNGGYEPEVVNVIERFLEPGDCAIDVGACLGYHTCLMSKLVGEKGLVLAFEPHFASFKYLVHHVHLANKLNNVECLRVALWKEDAADLKLWAAPQIGYHSFHKYTTSESYELVEGRKLDTLLTSEKDHPRLIKIDCEGTEAEILCGMMGILEKGVDCVIVELNYHMLSETGRSDMVIREYMAALGYDMFLISITDGNGGFRDPVRVAPNVPILIENGHQVNVMFAKQERVDELWSKTSAS